MKNLVKKFRKMYDENKPLFFLTSIIIICVIVIIIGLLLTFFIRVNTTKYGDRLDETKGVEVTKTVLNDVSEYLESTNDFADVNVRLSGKIVYVDLKVSSQSSFKEVKKLCTNSLDKFSEGQLEVYDIQFILTSDQDSDYYPTMGYKSAVSTKISWVNRNE